MIERKHAGDGGAAAHRRFERYRSTMQLDEGAHQREPQSGATMSRTEGMGLEPIEHLVLYIAGNARSAIGHGEYEGILEPLGSKGNGLAGRRKAHGIGEQIE